MSFFSTRTTVLEDHRSEQTAAYRWMSMDIAFNVGKQSERPNKTRLESEGPSLLALLRHLLGRIGLLLALLRHLLGRIGLLH